MNQQDLINLAEFHFHNLFTEDDQDRNVILPDLSFPLIPQETSTNMARMVTGEEIKKAMHDIGAFKAPGEDGFSAIFFHNNWSKVGDSVTLFVKSAWSHHDITKGINNTLVQCYL